VILPDGRQSLAWWGEIDETDDRGRLMVEAAKQVWNLPGEMLRRDLDVTNVRMYEQTANASLNDFGGKFFGSGGATGESIATGAFDPRESSTYNVAKSAIDTSASQIASTDQRARFVTVGGKPQQRRRAHSLQNFTDGLMNEIQLHRLKQRAYLDAAVTESGLGPIQFFENEDGRCDAERVIPTELAIDPLDGYVDGRPRTLYRRHPIPRDWLMAKFGGEDAYDGDKTREAIKNARAVTTAIGNHSDQIEVWEGWHLRTSKQSKDGWHCIGIDTQDGTLAVDEFTSKRHRIQWLSLEDRYATAWGNSMMSQVRPLQTQININLLRIARAQKLFSAGHLYVNRLAKVKKSTLTNEIGSVWEGTGDVPPQKITFEAASAEMYQQIELDAKRIFDVLGINRGSSVGDTSRGAGAPAAAMREEKAKVDQRMSVRQQRWERFHLDCVAAALDVVREIAERNGGTYVVSVPEAKRQNNAALTMADWKESALDEADYVLQVKPAAPTPTDPDGLISFAYDMIEAQAWTGKDLARYMNALDPDAETDEQSAQSDLLKKTFERLLYDKNAVAVPNEFTDADLALELGARYYALGEIEGVSPRNLERVRRYLRKCQKLQAMKQAAQQPSAPQQAQPAAA